MHPLLSKSATIFKIQNNPLQEVLKAQGEVISSLEEALMNNECTTEVQETETIKNKSLF